MDKMAEELLELIIEQLPTEISFGFAHPIYCRPSISVEVGRLIKQYREEKRMTQAALAQKMHMDTATVSRHEHGTNLTLESLPVYANKLGVSMHDLIPAEETVSFTDEKQVRINRTINRFQELHDLSDEKLDSVLSLVEGLITLSMEDKERPSDSRK